jgi:hypothetical protein
MRHVEGQIALRSAAGIYSEPDDFASSSEDLSRAELGEVSECRFDRRVSLPSEEQSSDGLELSLLRDVQVSHVPLQR